MHGDLIKCTALREIVKLAGLSVVGLQTAVADMNDIKKARYTIQVIVTCLFTFLQKAYKASSSALSLGQCAEEQTEDMFHY